MRALRGSMLLAMLIAIGCNGFVGEAKVANNDDVTAGQRENQLLAAASSSQHLDDETIDRLVKLLGTQRHGYELVNDTLITRATPVTRALTAHPECRPRLRAALLADESAKVRRYAAFSLGELRDAGSTSALQLTIATKLREKRRPEDAGTENDPRALLIAAVDAYAKIDSRAAFLWLLPFASDPNMPVRWHACESLARLPRTTEWPPQCTLEEMTSGRCAAAWQTWWHEHQHKADQHVFIAGER